MAGIHNYQWAQGEDLVLSLVYKSGPVGSEVPVNLTGYSLRMDISGPSGDSLYVFNSEALTDADPVEAGAQPDDITEATLGADGSINISIPRTVTLPGGPVYDLLTATPPVTVYNYDIFLRDTAGKQKKILQGQISIEKSVTLWA